MSTPPLNIVFLTSDQHHPDYVGWADERLRTPSFDRLAREGSVLNRSCSCSPVCTPTRATWVTGQDPSKHGAWNVGTILDEGCLSVARELGAAGYRTAMIGKSHLQPCLNVETSRWSVTDRAAPDPTGLPVSKEAPPFSYDTEHFRRWHGPWYGFEHAEINVGHADEPHSASMHYRAWLEDRRVDIARHFGGKDWGDAQAWDLPEEFHPCAWAADRAIAWLREHAGGPFYLNVNFPEPHNPMHVPEPWFSMYRETPMRPPTRRWAEWEDKPTIYREVIANRMGALGWHERYAMAGIARMGDALEAGPASAESYTEREVSWLRAYWAMISIMDHHVGRVLACLDELGLAGNTLVVYTSDHGDMMGDHYLYGKGPCHYQGAVRVPTVVRLPGCIPAGASCDALVNCVDLAPTFMAAAGLPVHPQMQGVDQMDVWTGLTPSARDGVWVDYRAEEGLYVNSYITERHRLSVHHTPDGDEFELYDLHEDPDEFTNLAAAPGHDALRADLTARMLREVTAAACPWQERIAFA